MRKTIKPPQTYQKVGALFLIPQTCQHWWIAGESDQRRDRVNSKRVSNIIVMPNPLGSRGKRNTCKDGRQPGFPLVSGFVTLTPGLALGLTPPLVIGKVRKKSHRERQSIIGLDETLAIVIS